MFLSLWVSVSLSGSLSLSLDLSLSLSLSLSLGLCLSGSPSLWFSVPLSGSPSPSPWVSVALPEAPFLSLSLYVSFSLGHYPSLSLTLCPHPETLSLFSLCSQASHEAVLAPPRPFQLTGSEEGWGVRCVAQCWQGSRGKKGFSRSTGTPSHTGSLSSVPTSVISLVLD